MMKLKLVQSEKTAKLAAPPPRRPNAERRAREYLTPDEVKKVIAAAKATGRNGQRDALLLSVIFRHGLRVSEAVRLTWDQIHFSDGTVLVTRAKRGTPATHFLDGDELRQLRKLLREAEASRFVFNSEKKGPLTTRTVHHIVQRAGEEAGIAFPIHPHMLRHAKGYQLAQRGTDTRAIQSYLGHRDIASTVTYTALAPGRLKGLEKDQEQGAGVEPPSRDTPTTNGHPRLRTLRGAAGGFRSLNECVHSTALLSFDGALRALAIYDDSGRLWRGVRCAISCGRRPYGTDG